MTVFKTTSRTIRSQAKNFSFRLPEGMKISHYTHDDYVLSIPAADKVEAIRYAMEKVSEIFKDAKFPLLPIETCPDLTYEQVKDFRAAAEKFIANPPSAFMIPIPNEEVGWQFVEIANLEEYEKSQREENQTALHNGRILRDIAPANSQAWSNELRRKIEASKRDEIQYWDPYPDDE